MLVTHPGVRSEKFRWTNLAARRSPLYLFQAVDFFIVVGVPDSGRVFKSWANHGSVCSCLHRGRAIAKVSPDKSKGFVGLVYSVINVLPPGEIFTDGNSQVLAAVNYFQSVSMDLIVSIDYSSPV